MHFANITETRTQMPALTKKALTGEEVILLKNGKPLLGLLDYREMIAYKKWKNEQQKKNEFETWLKSLPEESLPLEFTESISAAKKSDDAKISLETFLNR